MLLISLEYEDGLMHHSILFFSFIELHLVLASYVEWIHFPQFAQFRHITYFTDIKSKSQLLQEPFSGVNGCVLDLLSQYYTIPDNVKKVLKLFVE